MLLAEMLFEAKEIFSDDLIYVPLNNFPRFTISKEKYLKKKRKKKENFPYLRRFQFSVENVENSNLYNL